MYWHFEIKSPNILQFLVAKSIALDVKLLVEVIRHWCVAGCWFIALLVEIIGQVFFDWGRRSSPVF